MSSHESEAFVDLGYTPDEDKDRLHAERLARQKIDKVTDDKQRRAARKRRPSGSVRSFESDRDHTDEMAVLPPGFTEEPYDGETILDAKQMTHLIARRALTKSWAEKLGGENSREYRIWQERYNKAHPLPGADQPKGA